MIYGPVIEYGSTVPTSIQTTKLREHANWHPPAGCTKCQLRATAPGDAGPIPTWAKVAFAVAVLGLGALVTVSVVQHRRYG